MIAPALGTQRINVLLVEDSRSEGFVTQRQLQRLDDELDVIRATTLEDALTKIDNHRIDAILLDLGLPDSDGPNSIRTLNQRYPNIPIVVLSGRSDEVAVLRSLEYGAEEFLIKNSSTPQTTRQAIFNAIFRNSIKGNKVDA